MCRDLLICGTYRSVECDIYFSSGLKGIDVGGPVLKRVGFLAGIFTLLFLSSSAFGQTGDIAFGVSGLKSTYPSSSVVNSGFFYAPSLGGGTYLSVNGDYILWHNFGVGGELSWRATQNLYLGYQPYRPLFYSANAVYAPKINKRLGAEFVAGIGAESLHFYSNFYTCGFSGCTNYTSSNHFMGDFGAGLKIYATDHIFIRPEVRLYVIKNNFEFDSNHTVRAGVSIGYTFGGGN